MLTGICIPDSNCAVVRARGDALAIWRESDGVDLARVSSKWPCNKLAGVYIPDSKCTVDRDTGNALAIRRESGGDDIVVSFR
jgi:hypothetical protein